LRYSLPIRAGRRKRLSETFRGTREHAQARLDELTYAIKKKKDEAARKEPTKLKVAGLVDEFLTKHAYAETRSRTAIEYEKKLRSYVLPVIGPVKLTALDGGHVEEVFQEMRDDGLSAQTQIHVHRLMKQVLSYAVERGLIEENLMSKRKPPKADKLPIVPMVQEEIDAMLEAITGQPNETLYRLNYGTGIRRSEAVGLTWRNTNLESGNIRIVQSAHSVPGKGMVIERPKTHSSGRTVSMKTQLTELLGRHKTHQMEQALADGVPWSMDWPVFANRLGKMLTTDAITKGFKRIMEAYEPLDMSRWHLHDLRHTHVSILIEANVHPKKIQARLGHSSIQVTMDRYGHLMEGQDDDIAELFEQYGKEPTVVTEAIAVLEAV